MTVARDRQTARREGNTTTIVRKLVIGEWCRRYMIAALGQSAQSTRVHGDGLINHQAIFGAVDSQFLLAALSTAAIKHQVPISRPPFALESLLSASRAS